MTFKPALRFAHLHPFIEGELRDRPWCPWRVPKTDLAREFVTKIQHAVETAEAAARKPGQRNRKTADQETWLEILSRVSLDVLHHYLSTRSGNADFLEVAIPRDTGRLARASAYKSPAHSKNLPKALDLMVELGFLNQLVGTPGNHFRRRAQTTISAGPKLAALAEELELRFVDIGWDTDAQTIWLREAKLHGEDHGALINYTDTEQTHVYREEMREINAWLATAYITLVGAELDHIDVDDRALHRVFNQARFDRGGRLGGGWWMNMEKDLRLNSVLMNGCTVVGVDWSSCFLRLAYAYAGNVAPSGDLYDIPGIDQQYRPAVKALVSTRLFDTGPRTRKPKEFDYPLPPDLRMTEMIELIETRHVSIKESFGRGLGFELMYQESCLIVAVLLRLKEMGIHALPIHDCVLVSANSVDHVQTVMRDIPMKLLNVDIDVSIEQA